MLDEQLLARITADEKVEVVGGGCRATFPAPVAVWIDLQKDYELWHAATGSDGWKKVKTVEL